MFVEWFNRIIWVMSCFYVKNPVGVKATFYFFPTLGVHNLLKTDRKTTENRVAKPVEVNSVPSCDTIIDTITQCSYSTIFQKVKSDNRSSKQEINLGVTRINSQQTRFKSVLEILTCVVVLTHKSNSVDPIIHQHQNGKPTKKALIYDEFDRIRLMLRVGTFSMCLEPSRWVIFDHRNCIVRLACNPRWIRWSINPIQKKTPIQHIFFYFRLDECRCKTSPRPQPMSTYPIYITSF